MKVLLAVLLLVVAALMLNNAGLLPPAFRHGGTAASMPPAVRESYIPPDRVFPASAFAPRKSDWVETEMDFYTKLLARGHFDTLVVPFQVTGNAFDRATRSIMTAELALAIQKANQVSVPDTFLVERALGSGQRRIQPDSIDRLAEAIGAKQVIMGFAGHDDNSKMTVAIVTQQRALAMKSAQGPAASRKTHVFRDLGFSDETPAVQVYESLIPDILTFVGVKPQTASPPMPPARDDAALGATFRSALDTGADAARSAYSFELLASLTPRYLDLVRERFAAKSYLASLQVPRSAPEFTAVRVRALMAIGLRPAALKELAEPQSAEERELAAALNGNLPQIALLASEQPDPRMRMIELIDEAFARQNYHVMQPDWPSGAVKAMKLPGKAWDLLALRALSDSDGWLRGDNLAIKELLDAEFPVKDFRLSDIGQSSSLLGEPDDWQTRIGLTVSSHVKRFIEADAGRWCCLGPDSSRSPGALDGLDLLEAIVRDNMIREMKLVNFQQGLPEQAMRYAQALESAYQGESYYSLRRSEIESALAERQANRRGAGQEPSVLERAAHEHGLDALFIEGGQSHVSGEAKRLVVGAWPLGITSDLYLHDQPPHPYYSPLSSLIEPMQNIEARAQATLRHATSDFTAVDNLVFLRTSSPDRDRLMSELLKSIDGRFIGCPKRGELVARESLHQGDAKAAAAAYRENIRIAPDYWPSYSDLGTMLLKNAKPDEAADLFRAYPGFGPASKADRVWISNYASDAGSLFFWSGRLDLAKPFYELSSATQTGSDAEMSSTERLNLIAGRLGEAMAQMLERGQRYRDAYGYRNYLSMLHALGRSEDGWKGFEVLAGRLGTPPVWESAMVGHRRGNWTEQRVTEWAKSGKWKDLDDVRGLAALYLARHATTDRTPSPVLADVVNGLDMPTWKMDDPMGRVIRSTHNPQLNWIIGPVAPDSQGALPIGALEASKKHRIRSDLAYFVEAYGDLKRGQYRHAVLVLDEAAGFYDMTHPDFGVLLTYWSLAEARSGDLAKLKARLSDIPASRQGFDYQLSRAILAAATGNKEAALEALTLARYRREFPGRRPDLPQCTLGDIAKIVADMARDRRIVEFALDWARKNQSIEPWHAWSYSLQASLSEQPDERGRAIAIAHYLDPASERLSRLGRAEVDAAVSTYGALNPFLKRPPLNNESITMDPEPRIPNRRAAG